MKRTPLSRSVFLLTLIGSAGAAAVVTSACNSDSSESSGAQISEETFAEQFAVAYCDLGARCCSEVSLPPHSTCVSERAAAARQWAAQVKRDGELVFDPERAAGCLRWFRGGWPSCLEDLDLADDMNPDPWVGCRQGYRRPAIVEPGQPCHDDDDCIEPSRGYVLCRQSTCEQTVYVADGEPCGPTNLPGVYHGCGLSSWCDTSVPICRPGPGAGEECYHGFCGEGLACTSGSTCAPLAGAGEDCYSAVCGAELVCDPNREVCVELGPRVGAGEGCAGEWDCLSEECDYDSVAKRTQCGPLDPEGAGMVSAKTCNTSAPANP